jgi:membrane associated rhomboid family serine protease
VTAARPPDESWIDRLASWGQPDEQQMRSRFRFASWTGAIVIMLGATAVLWIIQVVNWSQNYALNRFGLWPRRVSGLWGLVTQPFLYDSWAHLLYVSVSFIAIGWVVLISGIRTWLIATAIIVLVGGLAAWLVAPSGVIVGASALVFGWLGYLVARAYFSRRVRWIVSAVLVLVFFGGLLAGLLPGSTSSSTSWASNLCGFAAGLLAGAVLHPRRNARARPRMSRAVPPVS